MRLNEKLLKAEMQSRGHGANGRGNGGEWFESTEGKAPIQISVHCDSVSGVERWSMPGEILKRISGDTRPA